MSDKIVNQKIQGLIQAPSTQPAKQKTGVGPAFSDVLQQQMDLRVSGHAQTRLQSRGIDLKQADWERVKDGIDRAAAKGSRESLVMLNDVALVVSVKNRTVITAVGREQLKDNVFTNIDSAVFV